MAKYIGTDLKFCIDEDEVETISGPLILDEDEPQDNLDTLDGCKLEFTVKFKCTDPLNLWQLLWLYGDGRSPSMN